ncbi:MAG: AraC family transcriptional regulator [Blautia sp.]|nr:AraC family transcriptional regulator [Blautia sp.]MCM1201406.1 AraC family transcriptional regulator [Bacteroides fragilis]
MITVNVCGYDSMHKMILDRSCPDGFDDYTLLLIKTESFFELNGENISFPPNTVMIYGIHSPVHYGCLTPHYNDDWIHFELHCEDTNLLHELAIPVNCPFTLPCLGTLTDYTRSIVQEKLSPYPYSTQVIDSLMHALLYSLSNRLHTLSDLNTNNKNYYSLNELRIEILNAPYKKWDIPLIAQKLNLSVSYFHHLYKQFFQTTCTQDIIHARIRHAQLYLCISEMSVSSLALFCGYDNELHFMRQFKKITGMTPSQYRKTHRMQNGKRTSFS